MILEDNYFSPPPVISKNSTMANATSTLTKIINATLLFLPPFFMSRTQISNNFLCTQNAYLSKILLKNLSKSLLVSTSFAEIIHPPHRCGISRCWLDIMIIAQLCLRLATIKGHSKMCRLIVLGGPKTSQYLVWPPFASRGATHLLRIELNRLLIVAWWMLVHSSSMALQSFWMLAGTGTHCRERRSRVFQTCSMGDMSGEYAGHARTGMFSASRNCVQMLATWGRALSCSNMRWWSWINSTTMGLRISLRYFCAFKMPSIKCSCVRRP